MNNMPKTLREECAADHFYKFCARANSDCDGRITWEHVWIYASKQIQEKWAIIPLCWYHHLGTGLDKSINEMVSIGRATIADLKRYPKKDWHNYVRRYLAI